jgi:hydroxymethylglutaryl-CoA lyase
MSPALERIMKEGYSFPESVTIIDGSVREGLQTEEIFVPTETKLFLLEGLIDAGFRCIEVGAFSPPDAMPQFRDTEEILRRLPRNSQTLYKCNTFTMKLVQRAVQTKQEGFGPDIINTQFSTTEEHSKAFFRKTVDERWKFIEEAIRLAHDAGLKIQVTILTVWYCPFRGEMPIEIALQTTDRLMERGCDIVRVADGLGDVTPDKVYEYCSRVLDRYPDSNRHTLHLHDHRGFGLASYVAAMQAGCSRFDTCLGGIGGPTAAIVGGVHARGAMEYRPRAGKTGLVSTEDFVVMCDAMGIDTGINVDKVLKLGKWMERILERKLWSFSLGQGRVPKGAEIIKGREKEMA